MELADPLQELLKSTGWSCDDLLEKLQKLKSTKSIISDKNISAVVQPTQKTDTGDEGIRDTENSPEKISFKEPPKNLDIHIDAEPFSDTDAEEEEVQVTNQSIINEIIDDITRKNYEEESEIIYETNEDETHEVTEVRVIEINSSEEDDNFEEECVNKSFSEDIHYWETYPRKSIPLEKPVIGSKRSSEEQCDSENSPGKIEYIETYPRKRIKLTDENEEEGLPVSTSTILAHIEPPVIQTNEITDASIDQRHSCSTLVEASSSELSVSQQKEEFLGTSAHLKIVESNEGTANNTTSSQQKKLICNISNSSSKKSHLQNDEIGLTNNALIDPEKSIRMKTNMLDENSELQVHQNINPSQNCSQSFDINHLKLTGCETFSANLGCEKVPSNDKDESDGNSPDPSFDDPILNQEGNDTSENVEDIRNNLKLQLSSLRTRKKKHFLQTQTKVIDNIECNKKLLNLLSHEDGSKKHDDDTIKTFEEEKTNSLGEEMEENQLFSQTNELGLVILDVQGGVDLEEIDNYKKSSFNDEAVEENSGSSSNNCEPDMNDDQHVVFDQIRKIIHKQKSSTNLDNDKTEKISLNHSQVCSDVEKSYSKKSMSFPDNFEPSFKNVSQELEKKSPFVSDSLDEFLIGNSKLNISYKVPKCGAEDGLKENPADDSPLLLKKLEKIKNISQEKPKKPPALKAKTVAHKRKLLEREQKKEQRKRDKLKKLSSYKIDKELEKSNKEEQNRSFVYFNNEKIWVKSKLSDKCIAKIDYQSLIKGGSPINTKRKLSLLAQQRKFNMQIKYLPGPLCKKSELQISGQADWETHTKNLPEILLEVEPTIGRRFPDHIINRLKMFDGELHCKQIEFALSTLKTKKDEVRVQPIPFVFPLKYHNNQEKIIIRKRKSNPVCYSSESSTNKDNSGPRDIIADVIEDLIRYVEIKEIAPTLIKDDESQIKDEEKLVKKLSSIDSNVSIFKKPQKKKSKIEYELLRLNCKLVNVELEENLTEGICDNLHCQLGCVCKSLKCENISNYHCQLVKCMFDCTCPKEKALVYEHSLTLPAGTDILSTDTVNRIEDEAKKYLAKEEKEFTQTVIHTLDKTIVVGLGSRSKLRRNTKTPAKYSDYVDSSESHKTKLPEKDFAMVMRCTVGLPRLNLSQIIPYCLTHNLYDCHCKGTSDFIPNMSVYPNKNNHLKTHHEKNNCTSVETKKPSKIQTYIGQDSVNSNDDSNHKSVSSSSQLYENTNIVSSSKRPIRNKKQKKYDENFIDPSNEMSILPAPSIQAPSIQAPPDCARTRMFLPQYRKPKVVGVDLNQNDFSNNITDSDILRLQIQYTSKNQKLSEVNILKQNLIEQYMGNILLSDSNKKKRKQTLSVRKDEMTSGATPPAYINEDRALQRRKKPLVSRVHKKVEAVFDGEIIIDRRNSELLKKMGPKTLQDGYARLLPWKALTESFKAGTINIWSMIDQPSRLLINRSNKSAPKNYVNIKQSNQTTDVILWILRNRLPSSYREDTVSFILKETKNNFEICGVCTRKLIKEDCNAKKTEEKDSNGASNKETEETDEKYSNGSSNKETEEVSNGSSDDEVFLHRDVNGEKHILETLKKKYKLQELVEESTGHLGEMSVDKNKLYMWAALPEIYRVCKWRVIYLNSDFAYLYFSGIKYSIRYTDLVNAGRIAKENNCTLRLTNDTLKSGYDHIEFAIYFDPHYLDRFFIGPYFKQFSGSDVETYRFINKSLVSTKSFNKMSGKSEYKCGNWLIERPYSGKRTVRPESSVSTIDLTHEDDAGNDTVNYSKSLRSQQSKGVLPHMVIMHNSEQVLILDAPSRKPEDFNRYIITNIPHLGYLGAYRHSSGEIDVSWPFEEKLLRFSNVTTAIDFLQERFSALLQPVPETFKINIIVLTQIDLNNAQPIDSAVLSGHYICGEFGFENITTMTSEECMKKLGMSREEILSMFAKRAKVFLEKRIENLASLLNIEGNNGYDISSIVNAATAEIRALLNQESNNISIKNELRAQKRKTAIKLFNMVSRLPPIQRNIESQKLRKVLNRSEPIEVHDSDEDGENNDSDKNDNLSKDKTVDNSDTGNPKNINLSKDSTNDQSNTDILKVLDSQQCLVSVMEAKNQTVLGADEPKRNDSISRSLLAKPCPALAKLSPSSTKSSPSKVTQKSILKPLIRVQQIDKTSLLARRPEASPPATKKERTVINPNLPTAQYISGVKLVKSVGGNFVLVSDKSSEADKCSSRKRGLVTGTKVIIQNNKIKRLRLDQDDIHARSKGDSKLDLNNDVDFQLIETHSSLETLNSDDTIIIDLDKNNDFESVLIQDNETSDKTKELCYEDRVCRMENKVDEQDQYSNEKNEVVIITEDDILIHSDDNVQSNNISVNIMDNDDLNTNEMMIIDLDETNELDNMLIQNDSRSLEEIKDHCNERVENNKKNGNEKNEVVVITEEDILIHSDDNVQSDHQSVNAIDITQAAFEHHNTVEKESVYDKNNAERNSSHSGTDEDNSDDDLVLSVNENCDIISSICDNQSSSNNEDIIFQKNLKKVC